MAKDEDARLSTCLFLQSQGKLPASTGSNPPQDHPRVYTHSERRNPAAVLAQTRKLIDSELHSDTIEARTNSSLLELSGCEAADGSQR